MWAFLAAALASAFRVRECRPRALEVVVCRDGGMNSLVSGKTVRVAHCIGDADTGAWLLVTFGS